MYFPKHVLALGRLKSGGMNKTEKSYMSYLESLKNEGKILWYKFEGLKLKLADRTYISPDFVVMNSNREIELHDTKGSKFIWTDDSKAKMKIAAAQFPFVFKVAIPKRGFWEIIEI